MPPVEEKIAGFEWVLIESGVSGMVMAESVVDS